MYNIADAIGQGIASSINAKANANSIETKTNVAVIEGYLTSEKAAAMVNASAQIREIGQDLKDTDLDDRTKANLQILQDALTKLVTS